MSLTTTSYLEERKRRQESSNIVDEDVSDEGRLTDVAELGKNIAPAKHTRVKVTLDDEDDSEGGGGGDLNDDDGNSSANDENEDSSILNDGDSGISNDADANSFIVDDDDAASIVELPAKYRMSLHQDLALVSFIAIWYTRNRCHVFGASTSK